MKIQRDPYHLYSVEELLSLRDDKSRWIVPHMIPRVGRSFIYGKGGEYKSAVMFDLCIAIASGGQMLEQFPIEVFGPVILLSTESSIYENRTRLLAHMRARNVNPRDVMLHYGQSRLKLDTKEGAEELIRLVDKVRPVFLVLDPYISFLAGNENSSTEVSLFTDVLDYIIEKFEVSVAVLHHANKSNEIRGSSAIQGWCDAILQFSSDRGVKLPNIATPSRVIHVKGEKQRNGREGLLFSAVPMHDDDTGLITFGIHADADGANVVVAMLKQEIYKQLRQSGTVLTKTELVNATGCAPDKGQAAVDWLHRYRLIGPGIVKRSTSPDGSRTRAVHGWEAPRGYSKVDVARAMLYAQRDAGDDEDDYQ